MTPESAAATRATRGRAPRAENPRAFIRDYLLNHISPSDLERVVRDLRGGRELTHEVRWQQSFSQQVEDVLRLCERHGIEASLLQGLASLPGQTPELTGTLIKAAVELGRASPARAASGAGRFHNAPRVANSWIEPLCEIHTELARTDPVSDPLAWIQAYFSPPNHDGGVRLLTVQGRVGIGRTRLCTEFAQRSRHLYPLIIRVRCSGGLTSARADLIRALESQLPADVQPELRLLKPDALRDRLRDAAEQSQGRFLLIFDDVDPPRLGPDDQAAPVLVGLLPEEGPFDILLVRTSDAAERTPALTVLGLTRDAATTLLLYGTHVQRKWAPHHLTLAPLVVDALQRFPAAIALANKMLSSDEYDVDELLTSLAELHPAQPPVPLVQRSAHWLSTHKSQGKADDGYWVIYMLVGQILRGLGAEETQSLVALSWLAPEQPVAPELLDAVVAALAPPIAERSKEARAAAPTHRTARRLIRLGLAHEVEVGRPAVSGLVQAVVLEQIAAAPDAPRVLANQELAVLNALATRSAPELDEGWIGADQLEQIRGRRDATVVHVCHAVERLFTWKRPTHPALERHHYELAWRITRYLRWEGSFIEVERLATSVLARPELAADLRRRIHLERGLSRVYLKEEGSDPLTDLDAAGIDPRPVAPADLAVYVQGRATAIKLRARPWAQDEGRANDGARAKALHGAAEQIADLTRGLTLDKDTFRVCAETHRLRAELLGAAAMYSNRRTANATAAVRALEEAGRCLEILDPSRRALEADWHRTAYLLARARLEASSEDRDIEAAVADLRVACDAQASHLSPNHPDMHVMQATLAKWLAVAGQSQEAEQRARASLKAARERHEEGSIEVAKARALLGFVVLWTAWRAQLNGTAIEVKTLQEARQLLESAVLTLSATPAQFANLRTQWRFDELLSATLQYLVDRGDLTPEHLKLLQLELDSMQKIWPPGAEQMIRRRAVLSELNRRFRTTTG